MITEHNKNAESASTADDESILKDLPLTLENTGFAADEMVECGRCGRTNAPTKAKCFYCGEQLAIKADNADLVRPNLRRLEAWEKGFNVIALQPGTSAAADVVTIARELAIEREALQKIFAAGDAMPLARVESQDEAGLLFSRLKKLGIECGVLPDGSFGLETPPKRLRSVEFSDSGVAVVDFNVGERKFIPADDLVLLVTGHLFEMKTESFEKRKKGKIKVIDQSDTSSDETVIDLYSRDDEFGFRIFTSGFDFSCLGADKSLLAAENMPKLIEKLGETFPAAKMVDEYVRIQDALGAVWDLESRKDFEGLRRSGFGKADFGNVVTESNLSQFNRYSRMQRQLI